MGLGIGGGGGGSGNNPPLNCRGGIISFPPSIDFHIGLIYLGVVGNMFLLLLRLRSCQIL